MQNIVELALGAALLVSAGAMVLKALINLRQRARGEHLKEADNGRVPVRRVPTLLIGALGGLVVGMTSVGFGVPDPSPACLSSTQSRRRPTGGHRPCPGDAAGGLGCARAPHLRRRPVRPDHRAGDRQCSGVFLGALVSSHAPPRLVRRALAIVLTASGLKLIGVPALALGIVLVAVLIVGPLVWSLVRRADGFASWARDRQIEAHGVGGDGGAAAPQAASGG